MSSILIKIFATALTLSQVTVQPESLKTSFDRDRDRGTVEQLLKDGCSHMRRAFDIEDINLDELISTAMEDPQAVAGDVKVLQGISFGDLHKAYRQFCKGETVEPAPVDLGEVITYYNEAVADLPDHTKLKGIKLPGVSTILDGDGKVFTEIHEPDHRRIWVPLKDIPESVQKAFVAAEDKRFYQHKGIDERGVIRAFMGNLTQPGRPAGGSTITQQLVKNLLVGDDVTYERKMREMIVATRIERTLTKDEILEVYLNSIYLGRASWGIEMAAKSYFGKSAKALTLQEGALLASLAKGPNFYNPERQPDRARERLGYVLTRMHEDGVITEAQVKQGIEALPRLAAFDRPRRTTGFHFVDHLARDARTVAGLDGGLTASSYTVVSTIRPDLQEAAEEALQDGLARYEASAGRQVFTGPEANLTEAVKALEQQPGDGPAWRRALQAARLPLYDVHWPVGVVLASGRDRSTGADVVRVGLKDGRVVPLATGSSAVRRSLKPYDVVLLHVTESKGKAVRAELRTRPSAQGSAVVLENRTGRILAMAGGFSYPLSQLNRATQAHRQPGSALKPLTYLAALARGLQPNTLIWDSPVTLPPVGGGSRARDYWTPKNYDGGSSGLMTLRRALENSKNLVTARLLDGGVAGDPQTSLNRVCELALEAQLYADCERYYPFVLGAQPVRVLDLAAFYAAIANEGARPTPYAIESIDEAGRNVYRRKSTAPIPMASADRAAFFQLKTMLQGVLERGTAQTIRRLAPYVGGKTGTSDNENDAWFVGFTNEVTVAVWVGYDNATGRRTLGRGQTGGKVAVPIFERIIEAVWSSYAPRTALAPPSPEAARQLVTLPIDLRSGDRLTSGSGGFREYFRLDRTGRLGDTQYHLVPREEAYAYREPDVWSDGEAAGGGWGFEEDRGGPYATAPHANPYGGVPRSAEPRYGDPRYGDPRYGDSRSWRGPFARPWWEQVTPAPRQRRVDPDYFWGRGPSF